MTLPMMQRSLAPSKGPIPRTDPRGVDSAHHHANVAIRDVNGHLAPYRVPGTDLGTCLLASDLAPYRVPGTDLGPCLLASDLAPHRVLGIDLGTLFASIRPGAVPGAWHRFGPPVC